MQVGQTKLTSTIVFQFSFSSGSPEVSGFNLAFVRNFIKIFLINSGYGQTDSEASELFPNPHKVLDVSRDF
jgi:hypothetical protein